MDLYAKVEKVIQDHINEHKQEVRRGKQLLGKLDVARCNPPTQDYSFDLSATGEHFPETTEDDYEEFWYGSCLLYTSPSPRDMRRSRMPSSA